MAFSFRNTIGKKILAIIFLSVIISAIMLFLGYYSVKIVDVCVTMTRCERDHTMCLNQAHIAFEKYIRKQDEKTFQAFLTNAKTSIHMTETTYHTLNRESAMNISERALAMAKVFPSASYSQCYELAFVVNLLFSHELIEMLLAQVQKSPVMIGKYIDLAKEYKKILHTGDGLKQSALLAEIEQLSKDMKHETDVFSEGCKTLSLWTVHTVKKALMALFPVLMGILLVIGFAISRSISKPLKQASEFANRIANGDYSTRITIHTKDETAFMARALNQVCNKAGKSIDQIIQASRNLAKGVSHQSSSIKETASSLEEMFHMIAQNAYNAQKADDLMKKTSAVVKTAGDAMEEMTSSIQELSRVSSEIKAIIKTIDEIAFQTNLLSLNAAVEAARAGEAGAGFAVVADEVRNLAMRSANSASSTATLIEDTVEKIDNQIQLVRETAINFSEVASHSAQVGELIQQVFWISKSQETKIQEINAATSEIEDVVKSNAMNADELVRSVSAFRTNGNTQKKDNFRKKEARHEQRPHAAPFLRDKGSYEAPLSLEHEQEGKNEENI